MAAKTKSPPAPKPARAVVPKANAHLLHGADDFLVEVRARQILDSLVKSSGNELGLETIEGRVDNAGQAVQVLKRVDEALNTFSLFGGGKTVWLKNANFLGTSRPGDSKDVLAQLDVFADLLKRGLPNGFALVVTATEVDKRRGWYKTFEKAGEVVALGGAANDWGKIDFAVVESFARQQLKAHQKEMQPEALQTLMELTGANFRALASEIEKLATYVGNRPEITVEDVAVLASPSGESSVWALSDAIGERNLPKALQVLDQLLFQGENAVGMLFALIGSVRNLLLIRELIDRKVLQSYPDYGRFKASLERIPPSLGDEYPSDRRFNPLLVHPFRLHKLVLQASRFTLGELRRAMESMLEANKQLVSSSLDDKIVMEQLLIGMLGKTPA